MNPTPPIPAPEGEEKALPIGKLWIKRDTVSMGEKYTPQERLRVYVKPHDGAHAYVPEAALSAEKQRGPRAVEEAKKEERLKIIAELREDGYRCTFGDYTGSMDKGWLYSVAQHLEDKLAQASRAAKEPS